MVAYMRASLRFEAASLLAPPAGCHLDFLRVVAGAEREVLAAFRARFHVPHRVLAKADRVPLLELDDLVVDLRARRALDHDVDLFLGRVLVAERNQEARGEREERESERLALDRAAREAGLHLGRHVELRRRILDIPEICPGVAHQLSAATAPRPMNIPPEAIRTILRRRRMKPPIVPPAIAYAPSERKPSATKTRPSTAIWVHTVRSRSTNCGRKARKKSAVFGFRTLTITPCVNTRAPLRGGRAGRSGSSSFSSHFLIPMKTRYAAPTYLTVENAIAELTISAERPAQAAATWTSEPTWTPATESRPRRRPPSTLVAMM